jgi:hypothetical protein
MQSATTTSTQKTNGHAPGTRFCKCNCGGTVPAANRFNYIKGHMKRKSATKRGPYKTKMRKAAREAHGETPAPVAATPAPVASLELSVDSQRVALQVTEAQLNQFLVKLTFAEKQHLANYYLRSELLA